MQRTLHEHIRFLEGHILALSGEMARPIRTEGERNRLQVEILIAEQALDHFKIGYELEQKMA